MSEVYAERKVALDQLVKCVLKFDSSGLQKTIKSAMKLGITPSDILKQGIGEAMKKIGALYERSEFFLTDLILAGETVKAGMVVLAPYLKADKTGKQGTVVIGTVKEDIHDLGKNIVVTLLKSAGFEVHDLGVDVPYERFVQKAQEVKAHIVAMSTLMSTTMPNMKAVIDQLKSAGIRERVKVIVGGAPTTAEFARMIGADAQTTDAFEGLEIMRQWIECRPSS